MQAILWLYILCKTQYSIYHLESAIYLSMHPVSRSLPLKQSKVFDTKDSR